MKASTTKKIEMEVKTLILMRLEMLEEELMANISNDLEALQEDATSPFWKEEFEEDKKKLSLLKKIIRDSF